MCVLDSVNFVMFVFFFCLEEIYKYKNVLIIVNMEEENLI